MYELGTRGGVTFAHTTLLEGRPVVLGINKLMMMVTLNTDNN